jgi:hypothetical protein
MGLSFLGLGLAHEVLVQISLHLGFQPLLRLRGMKETATGTKYVAKDD